MQIDNVSRVLLHVQRNCHNFIFFSNVIFPYQMCTILKKVLALMIIKAKTLEIGKFHFKMHLNIFVSISFQTCF
jgi:hypothetical protein